MRLLTPSGIPECSRHALSFELGSIWRNLLLYTAGTRLKIYRFPLVNKPMVENSRRIKVCKKFRHHMSVISDYNDPCPTWHRALWRPLRSFRMLPATRQIWNMLENIRNFPCTPSMLVAGSQIWFRQEILGSGNRSAADL